MRASSRLALVLASLGAVACGSPLAAAPLVASALRGPEALAAPTEDGSVYVLAEGGPTTSPATLKSVWRRKATQACEGDYMVMSEQAGQSRRGGLVGGRLYEGFVRCVSPEGVKPE